MLSGIWSVAATRIDFWTWIWSTRHCGLGQEVNCWSQCWKNSTSFVWPCDNTVAIDAHLLRCRSRLSLLNWIRVLTLSLLLKVLLRKLEPWFVLWSFFLLRLFFICINLPYNHAWNIVVMSGLVLQVATWSCWVS